MGKDMAKSTGITTKGGFTPKAGPKSRHGGRKKATGRGTPQDTMIAGIARDQMEAHATMLLDELDPLMVCPVRISHETLREAFKVLIETFVSLTEEDLRTRRVRRFEAALEKAVRGIEDQPLRKYFVATTKRTNRRVEQRLKYNQQALVAS